MKKALGYIGRCSLLLLILAMVFSYLAPGFGWRSYTVVTGSMEPQLRVGSLVVAHTVEPETIAVGDIIIFEQPAVSENPISHRVIGIGKNSSLYFQTKGDANDDSDPFIVSAADLLGKVCFHVPFLGYAAQSLKTTQGLLFALAILGLIIAVTERENIYPVFTTRKIKRARDKVVSE